MEKMQGNVLAERASSDPQAVVKEMRNGEVIVAVTWVFTSFSIIIVILRLAIRKKFAGKLLWDDWLMLPAVPAQIAYQTCVTYLYVYAVDSPSAMMDIVKWSSLSVLPATIVAICARVSAAIFLIRVFGTNGLVFWFKWYLIILTSVQVVAATVGVTLNYASVTPFEAHWNMTIPRTQLVSPDVLLGMAIVVASSYSLADLTFVLFPVMIAWKLKMPTRRRAGLVVLLLLSIFTTAVSILKASSTISGGFGVKAQELRPKFGAMWVALEQTMIVIMGCLPPLLPLAKVDHPIINRLKGFFGSIVSRVSGGIESAQNRDRPSLPTLQYISMELDERDKEEFNDHRNTNTPQL